MLPFTKRPGRSEDMEAVTNAGLVRAPNSEGGEPAVSVRNVGSSAPMRAPAPSADEEEMTTVLDRPSIPERQERSVPLPAAGRPITVPPPPVSLRAPPPSLRPPPPSLRGRAFARPVNPDADAEGEDSRTVAKGTLRKIVKGASSRSLGPQASATSLSPDAVLKATLDSAFASRRDQLMPGPPADLLEDSADLPRRGPVSFGIGSGPPRSFDSRALSPAPASSRAPLSAPRSAPLPPSSQADLSRRRVDSASVNGVVMAASAPAHFMTPQAPYSDPVGTAVTAGHRASGRPARWWAVALAASGLFVAVGSFALVRAGGSVADAAAGFVDPSRPSAKAARASAKLVVSDSDESPSFGGAASSSAAGSATVPAAVMPAEAPAESAVAITPVVTPAASVVAADGPASASSGGAAGATVAGGAAPPKPAVAPARPVAAWHPPPQAPVAAPRPPSKPAVAEAPAPKKPGKSNDTDDETRKAIEALQKAQLESSSSFGDK